MSKGKDCMGEVKGTKSHSEPKIDRLATRKVVSGKDSPRKNQVINKQKKGVQMNQKEMVKLYLEKYGSITAMQGFIDLGIVDLAGTIRDLKEEGYETTFTWVYKKNKFGKPIKFKRYLLPTMKKVPWYKRVMW